MKISTKQPKKLQWEKYLHMNWFYEGLNKVRNIYTANILLPAPHHHRKKGKRKEKNNMFFFLKMLMVVWNWYAVRKNVNFYIVLILKRLVFGVMLDTWC